MKALRALAALLMLASWAAAAYGDGGTILLHQDAGAFTITLFAAPQPLQVGSADFSVMVQEKAGGDVLLDPVVDLTLAPQAANATPRTIRLARGQAGNRLLQAATVDFSEPGQWRLSLEVRRSNNEVRRSKNVVQSSKDVAYLSTECTVEPNRSRTVLVWFYVLLPVGIVLLFVIHQALKHQALKHQARKQQAAKLRSEVNAR
ncbi:MAG: hypothetical protein WA510_06210 [Acidobacteriaceae bacterium]